MSFTLSQSALPAFETGLNALTNILDKAAAYAAAKKIDEAVLLQTRMVPDMFPFARQIQIVTDTAKNGSARMAGVEAPKHEDNETSIAELKTRIAETLAFLKTIDAKAFDASASKQVTFPLGKANKGEMTGDAYITSFVLPNFYFHLTTAYAILRNCGVEVGKMDFLGKIAMTRTPV
jgi:uncharacterized protein